MTRDPRPRHPADPADVIPFGQDPVDAFTGCAMSFVGDESIQHDHYLYGWSKEPEDARPGSED